MATLASSALTLTEWATRLDPGGKPAAVIELLGQTNEMLTDMLWISLRLGNHRLSRGTSELKAPFPPSNYRQAQIPAPKMPGQNKS